MDDDVPESIALARAVSRVDPSSPLFRALSWNADATGPSVLGVPMTEPSGSFGLDDEDTDHEEHRVKGAVKGFLGKLRPRPAYQPG